VPLHRYCPQCGHVLPAPDQPSRDVRQQDCPACGAVHFRNAKPCAGVLIVRGGEVLLGKRNRQPFRDWWDIPGGFLDPWEHPEQAAVREAAEETGLVVRPTALLGIFLDTYGQDAHADFTLNIYYLAEIVSGAAQAGDDLSELAWFKAGALPERIAFPDNAREVLSLWERQVAL
jgi:ADP-ribose pyrophosphatase YjhB (NUDIX family)